MKQAPVLQLKHFLLKCQRLTRLICLYPQLITNFNFKICSEAYSCDVTNWFPPTLSLLVYNVFNAQPSLSINLVRVQYFHFVIFPERILEVLFPEKRRRESSLSRVSAPALIVGERSSAGPILPFFIFPGTVLPFCYFSVVRRVPSAFCYQNEVVGSVIKIG